ncbi:MAG TPA: hypothetical protein VMU92_04675 [Acidobacteriaceae bacterium]|nr:hypothetical protein [Acidobacteriaceae bacterium]
MMANDVNTAINDILHQRVWGVEIAIGTRLSMEFGDEVLMPGHRRPHGKWHLLLMDCYWRIEDGSSIVVGSDDSDLMVGIQGLDLGKVNKIQLLPPTSDLQIVFENNLRLITFLTHSRVTPNSRQWYLYCPDDFVWSAEGGGRVICKNRYES